MSSLQRMIKRIIIATVFFSITALIAGGLYAITRPKETCSDRIKNQNETEVDCGGVCQACVVPFTPDPIETLYSAFIPADGAYDVVALLRNKNINHGVSELKYRWRLLDSAGRVVAEKTGKTFVLPDSDRFLIGHIRRQNAGESQPTRVELKIESAQWERLKEGRILPVLSVFGERLELLSDNPLGFARVTGDVGNDSFFDLARIHVNVVLFDAANNPLAVGSTEIDTVLSGGKRFFQIIWQSPIRGTVQRFKVEALTNIFDNENFLERYGTEEHFLEFEER